MGGRILLLKLDFFTHCSCRPLWGAIYNTINKPGTDKDVELIYFAVRKLCAGVQSLDQLNEPEYSGACVALLSSRFALPMHEVFHEGM